MNRSSPIAFFEDLDSPYLGIIMDQGWYNDNKDAFAKWLTDHSCDGFGVDTGVGGFFIVPDDKIKMLMLLRWT